MKTLDEAVKSAQARAIIEHRELGVYLLADGKFAVYSPRSAQAHSAGFTGALHVAHVRRAIVSDDQGGGWRPEVDYLV